MGAGVAATDYLQTRGWLYADRFAEGSSGAATFRDEEELWAAALGGHGFYETRRLTLEDVVLTGWLPRSPGRYFTQEAKMARDEAGHRILEQHDGHVVYSADGKSSMVQGGIGCLRLAMKNIGGEEIKFLGATSSGVVHRSFVVAVSSAQYESIAGVIDEHGGVRCTVAGRVRSWNANDKIDLFLAAGVPRVYLGVDELRRGTLSPSDLPALDVTPAVTFTTADGEEYFTFSHFTPADPGDVDRAVEWMGRYVGDRYHGRVMTDFDELVSRFDDTAAPLKTLMSPEVPFKEIVNVLRRDLDERTVTFIINNNGSIEMGDRYEVSGGQVGAFGPGAAATNFIQNQQIDLPVLAEELARLREALEARAPEAEQATAVDEVAKAEEAARQGDERGALGHLKRAGHWVLGVATDIGVPLATAVLKSVLT